MRNETPGSAVVARCDFEAQHSSTVGSHAGDQFLCAGPWGIESRHLYSFSLMNEI